MQPEDVSIFTDPAEGLSGTAEKRGSKPMKKVFGLGIATLAAATVIAGLAIAQDTTAAVKGLRSTAIDGPAAVDGIPKQEKHRFTRNYRQQPPLIPHAIDQYQIDLNTNQCLGCHDWSRAGEKGAPTLSMTHYLDRERKQLDRVAGTRWFCNQCHVPQVDAEPLVGNDFVPSSSQ